MPWAVAIAAMVSGGSGEIDGAGVPDDGGDGGKISAVPARPSLTVTGDSSANCPDGDAELAYIMGEGGIEKTVFSGTHRAVFFAGVGGTGHHLFQTVTQRCGREEDPICRDAPFRPLLWHQVPSQKRRSSSKLGFWNSPPKHKQHKYCQLKLAMANSTNSIPKTPAGRLRLDVLNTMMSDKKTGMMSYPNL